MMENSSLLASQALQKAREQLRTRNLPEALHWARQLINIAPNQEEGWLIMAACSQPEDSVRYLIKALEINPGSQRARQGMDWAIKRLRKLQQEQQSSVIKAPNEPVKVIPSQAQSPTSLTKNTMWLKVTG